MIDNNRVTIFFLVPRFVVNNHTERLVGIVCYFKHIAVLGQKHVGEKTQRPSAYII